MGTRHSFWSLTQRSICSLTLQCGGMQWGRQGSGVLPGHLPLSHGSLDVGEGQSGHDLIESTKGSRDCKGIAQLKVA